MKLKETSQEAERLTDTQFNKGAQDGNKDLEKAKQAIQVWLISRFSILFLISHTLFDFTGVV